MVKYCHLCNAPMTGYVYACDSYACRSDPNRSSAINSFQVRLSPTDPAPFMRGKVDPDLLFEDGF